MTSPAMLQALFGFNQSMNNRLWAIILDHLTDAQFTRTNDYSRGSIRNQLLHMANAQYYWLSGLLDLPDLPFLDAQEYPTRQAAREVCRQSDQYILNIVRAMSDADLRRVPDGWSQPVWVALLQLAHHATDHRAQILHALHDLGAPTFEQNFAIYMENVAPMTGRELRGHIAAKRAQWDELLAQMPPEQMDRPAMGAWTARDVVAILTWKEQQVAATIRHHAVIEAGFGELPEAEQAAILQANRALPLPALLDRHHAAHRDLLDALRSLTDDELNAEGIPGFPPDERFWKAVAGPTWWSYPAFSHSLRRLLHVARYHYTEDSV